MNRRSEAKARPLSHIFSCFSVTHVYYGTCFTPSFINANGKGEDEESVEEEEYQYAAADMLPVKLYLIYSISV